MTEFQKNLIDNLARYNGIYFEINSIEEYMLMQDAVLLELEKMIWYTLRADNFIVSDIYQNIFFVTNDRCMGFRSISPGALVRHTCLKIRENHCIFEALEAVRMIYGR